MQNPKADLSAGSFASAATAAPRPGAEVLDVKGVRRGFSKAQGELLVLDDVNLTLREGEIVGLLGRSGSGKSTLLRIIAGLIEPTAGEVRYLGEPLSGPAEGVAMVFQTFALFPWLTVLQNVEAGLEAQGVGARERRERALAAIDLIGLDGFENAYPRELSGGMRQRVGFARALVVDPTLLLMDEPFSALDMQTRTLMPDELLQLWSANKGSVVFVTHDLEEAIALADRVFVLTARPATLKKVYQIDLPRPRITSEIRYEPRFIELSRDIWHDLREEVQIA
jgi:NitT/TauT family transport system ATP-binding protein